MSLLEPDETPALFQPEVLPHRAGPASGYVLFFAIRPQPEVAQLIGLRAEELRKRHALRGQCLKLQHLHMTLQAVAGFKREIPARVVEAARAAAAGVNCPPFPLVFERACSFKSRSESDKHAFVLRCDARSAAAVARLRHALGKALRRSGLSPKPSSTPHMTMLYDPFLIPEHPIEPLIWTATRFALILSHQGEKHHEWLNDWLLK